MFRFCNDCSIAAVCANQTAMVVSAESVRDPLVRLRCQNHLVGLDMPYGRLVDYLVDALRDFPGDWMDENGNAAQAPGIACVLNDGADYWFRDQVEGGKWKTVADVPKLRREAIGRWILIATVKGITETVQPPCDPRGRSIAQVPDWKAQGYTVH